MGLPFLTCLCAFLGLLEFPEGHGSGGHPHTTLKITKVMDGPKQQAGPARRSSPTVPGLWIDCTVAMVGGAGSGALVVMELRWLPARLSSSPCSKAADPAG